ncbi:MAG: DUF4870 domain-containing protein [Gammaproteobacteria bacterium]|nr:DUF4870 domain-containing protein [Gammaproteobacteria bacterium]
MEQQPEVQTTASPDEKTWGMLCHLIAFSGYLIPFGSILGPLVIWLIKREEMPFVDDQGKESLNFQITMMLAAIVSIILIFVVVGFLLLGLVIIFQFVMVIIASIAAYKGEAYRYPLTVRFIK